MEKVVQRERRSRARWTGGRSVAFAGAGAVVAVGSAGTGDARQSAEMARRRIEVAPLAAKAAVRVAWFVVWSM